MTALILRAMQLVEIVVRKLRTICQGFLHAFVETTMRNAVPKPGGEINPYRRLLYANHKIRVKTLTPDVDLRLIPMGRGGMARGARVSGQSNCRPKSGRAPRTQ
jgi:hypothetical protein